MKTSTTRILTTHVSIDIPSDGEYSKSSFSNYANERLSGFEPKEVHLSLRNAILHGVVMKRPRS